MTTSIRKIEPSAYRRLKARAALEGKTVGQALTEAIDAYTGDSPETVPQRTRQAKGRKGGATRPRPDKPVAGRGFTRPPPARGEFVDDPFVVFEVEDDER